MKQSEAIKFLKYRIENANPEELRNIICGCFSPLCSNDCPLRVVGNPECEKIIEDCKQKEKKEISENKDENIENNKLF